MSQSLNIRGWPSEVFNVTNYKRFTLGTRMHLSGGRVFRYAQNGASQISAGYLVQSPQNDTLLANRPLASVHQVGASTLTLSVSLNSVIALNTYEDGLVCINDGTGQGYLYHIGFNPEIVATSSTLLLYLDNSTLQTTMTTASEATVIKNRFKGTTLAITDPDEPVVGIAPVTVAANNYYWVQTGGPTVALQDGTLFAYRPITHSNTVKGAVRNLVNIIPSIGTPTEEGSILITTLNDDGVGYKETLARVSGIGVIPAMNIGYAIDPRADTEMCLVHLSIEI